MTVGEKFIRSKQEKNLKKHFFLRKSIYCIPENISEVTYTLSGTDGDSQTTYSIGELNFNWFKSYNFIEN